MSLDYQTGFGNEFATIILRGWCERPGNARIGFGKCRRTVLPALGVSLNVHC